MKYRGWWDKKQVDRYLIKSLIRLEKEPIYITGTACIDEYGALGDIYLIYYPTKSKRQGKIKLFDPRINLDPVPLGYVGFSELAAEDEIRYTSLIVSRMPARMQKIGLCSENVVITAHQGLTLPDERLSVASVLTSSELSNTIKGEFPPYNYAYTLLTNARSKSLIPFSRKFAICNFETKQNHLFYSRFPRPIGKCYEDNIILYPDFAFLQESLNEDFKNE